MDWVRNFQNKTESWAGSTHFQIIPTSKVWPSKFIQTLIASLRGPADFNQLEHEAATVPFVTTHTARGINVACPYPNKTKRRKLYSFHTRSAYRESKSINKYCELQKEYDRHNSVYHNLTEKKKKKKCLSTTQQQYPRKRLQQIYWETIRLDHIKASRHVKQTNWGTAVNEISFGNKKPDLSFCQDNF
jgi:hypothetical protein